MLKKFKEHRSLNNSPVSVGASTPTIPQEPPATQRREDRVPPEDTTPTESSPVITLPSPDIPTIAQGVHHHVVPITRSNINTHENELKRTPKSLPLEKAWRRTTLERPVLFSDSKKPPVSPRTIQVKALDQEGEEKNVENSANKAAGINWIGDKGTPIRSPRQQPPSLPTRGYHTPYPILRQAIQQVT